MGTRKQTRILHWLVLSVLVILQAGCGYQLRGDRHLPAQMARTFVTAPDMHGPLVRYLWRDLKSAGVTVTAQRSDATAILEILDDDVHRRVLSVGSTGKAREFELHQRVEFRLRDAGGNLLVDKQEIALTRDFVFDETDVLGKSNEEGLVRRELQQDVVRLMLLRLEVQGSRTMSR